MVPFQLSEDALSDIAAIGLYLSDREGPEISDRIAAEIFQSFKKLAEFPYIGHRRPDLTNRNVLFYKKFAYLIVYKPEFKPLRIFGILHGSRNIARILRRRL